MSKRVDIIDALRGVCILLMVAFHFGYDLVNYAGAPQSLIYNPLLMVLQPFFAGVFILLSGISCRFSRSNARRGVQMLAAGIAVSLVTWHMDNPAWFGILHFLGVAALFFAAYDRIRPGKRTIYPKRDIAFLALMAVLFTVSYILTSYTYDIPHLWIFGIRDANFNSSDYFPLFPWIFVYAAGTRLGLYVTHNRLPPRFYTLRVPFFAAAGRNTLWIYLAHQPVLYGITLLIVQLTQV